VRRIAGAAALAVVALLPAHAEASPRQFTIFQAPHELLSSDEGLRSRTLDEIQALGVDHLRVILYWQAVAPQPDAAQPPTFDERDPAVYDWGTYASAIDEAHARGMRILLTISGPVPRWATAHHRDHRTRPSPVRFRRFVTAVGRRFGSDVSTWSIWNEPNHPRFLLPQYTRHGGAVSGRIHRDLFFARKVMGATTFPVPRGAVSPISSRSRPSPESRSPRHPAEFRPRGRAPHNRQDLRDVPEG
jgi:hypothetical protein